MIAKIIKKMKADKEEMLKINLAQAVELKAKEQQLSEATNAVLSIEKELTKEEAVKLEPIKTILKIEAPKEVEL